MGKLRILYKSIMPIVLLSIITLTLMVTLFGYSYRGYITNPERYDGFGAQYQTIIYSVIYAEMNNLPFVYTPFKSMEHNYDNDQNFLQQKEFLINFIGNFELIKTRRYVRRLDVMEAIYFFENNLPKSAQTQSLQKVKQLFRANKPANFFNNDKFNIAIHVRRPNSHDNRIYGADVPDRDFLRIIAQMRTEYADKDYLIHIYSQGSMQKFQQYAGDRIVFHLDESIEDTFTGMVLADVLVLSPSSFSYTAGLISNGKVYYMPFWHPPLPGWEVLKT